MAPKKKLHDRLARGQLVSNIYPPFSSQPPQYQQAVQLIGATILAEVPPIQVLFRKKARQ
jgi:hypothetical protein